MKVYPVYECEECGYTSKNKEDILKCEIAHLGMTADKKREHKKLEEEVNFAKYLHNLYPTENSQNSLNIAVSALQAFEREIWSARQKRSRIVKNGKIYYDEGKKMATTGIV